MRHRLIVLGIGATALIPAPAAADLQFCNRTSFEIYAAVGERPDYDYLSTGWYNLGAGRCRIVLQGDLDNDSYWAFAINTGRNYKTAGNTEFCVIDDQTFKGLDRDDCRQSNRRREDFRKIDVGYADDYTVYFEGRQGDTSASMSSSDGIEDSGANAGYVSDGGSGCTASEVKMCGDPSAKAYNALTVPNMSDRSVAQRVADKVQYGRVLYDDPIFGKYLMQFLQRY